MSVNWGEWKPFEGAPGRPLHEVDRRTACRYFDDLMTARAQRKRALEQLVERNRIVIGADDAGLQCLDDWYQSNVAADRRNPDRLADRWYAVGLDIGLYLGDAIIDRAPSVKWRLFTGSRHDASYQRPVLMGFRGVKNERYNIDPERLVGTHGHRLVAGDDELRDLFVQLVNSAASKG